MPRSRLQFARRRAPWIFGRWFSRTKFVVFLVIVTGVFGTLFLRPYVIESPAMKDTLRIGDVVLVNRAAYGYARASCPFDLCPFRGRILYSPPRRGDVALFARGPGGGTRGAMVLRIIGLPGDLVQIRGGRMWLNGAVVPMRRADSFTETFAPQGARDLWPRCSNAPVGEGGACRKLRWRETLPGARGPHDVLTLGAAGMAGADTPAYRVPKGDYFVLGDNRDNSADSRVAPAAEGAGLVARSALLGQVMGVLFSVGTGPVYAFWNWRPGRILASVP